MFSIKQVILESRGSIQEERGSTAAETAITVMTFLMIVLGIIQISLLIHAKFLVNYAAYNAVRAGIVHNGDQYKMRQAAAVSLAPIASNRNVVLGYFIALAAPDLSIDIVSPNPERFAAEYPHRFFPTLRAYGAQSNAPGNDQQHLDENLLKVKVTYHYRLGIPYIKTILSPFLPYVTISSSSEMRMQSDAYTTMQNK